MVTDWNEPPSSPPREELGVRKETAASSPVIPVAHGLTSPSSTPPVGKRSERFCWLSSSASRVAVHRLLIAVSASPENRAVRKSVATRSTAVASSGSTGGTLSNGSVVSVASSPCLLYTSDAADE